MNEAEVSDDTPCSSIAVDSIVRIGYAGLIWGLCSGSYNANKSGLMGIPRFSYVAKSVGSYGLQCGLFAGIFSFTNCGLQRYRGEKDWVNAFIAGGVAGVAVGAGNRNWKQIAGLASVVSAACSAAGDSKII